MKKFITPKDYPRDKYLFNAEKTLKKRVIVHIEKINYVSVRKSVLTGSGEPVRYSIYFNFGHEHVCWTYSCEKQRDEVLDALANDLQKLEC